MSSLLGTASPPGGPLLVYSTARRVSAARGVPTARSVRLAFAVFVPVIVPVLGFVLGSAACAFDPPPREPGPAGSSTTGGGNGGPGGTGVRPGPGTMTVPALTPADIGS